MLLVIPVSEADVHMADDVMALMKAFGPYQHHDLLVVGSTENANDVNRIREAISPMFRKSEAHIFDCPAKGWPLGPNYYFRASILHMFANGLLDQPWYWFELDNTPLKAGWLDALQTEYNLSQAIFMGPKQATFYKDKDNQLVIDGHHMCGTAIYPGDFTNRSALWKFENGIAFDVWIQWEVLPHLHDTQLMQHNWKTRSYRRKNGQIISDNFDMPHPDLKTNTPVRSEAVVCHGCKDGSLAKLILEELGGASTAAVLPPDDLGPAGEPGEPGLVQPRFDTEQLVFPKTRKRIKVLEEACE